MHCIHWWDGILIMILISHIMVCCACIIWAATWENRIFAYAKTKTQISFSGSAPLFSQLVQSLCFLSPKFQFSSNLVWLYSPISVGPGRKSRRPVFSRRGSYIIYTRNATVLTLSLHTSTALFLRTNAQQEVNIYWNTLETHRFTATVSSTWLIWYFLIYF